MSINKKIRKQKYKEYLLEKYGFILNIKDRGEYAEFENQTCFGSFEIGGGFKMPYYYYNLHIKSKDKYHPVSNEDFTRITNLIEKKYKPQRDIYEPPHAINKFINIFKSWFRPNS